MLSVKFILYVPSSAHPVALNRGDADLACPARIAVRLHTTHGADTLERSGSCPKPLSLKSHSNRDSLNNPGPEENSV